MKVYLEPCEAILMKKATTNLRDELLIHLLLYLGCRISEALALAIEDIDFNHGTITIQHLKASLKLSCSNCGQRLGRSHTFCPKCGIKVEKAQAEHRERRRRRVLPLDSDTLGMLREYVRRGGPVLQNGKKLLFGINRHRAWQIVKECAEKAELPKLINPETGRVHNVSPHRLRDCFAVMAVRRDDSTDSVRMLQEWLGHANVGTTMRYRKVAGDELKEWYQNLWSSKQEDNG
jgi:integrase/recombinase XerD